MKKAVLLINLGTPKSTDPNDVGTYLTEFLTDKYVIDIPFLLRHFLVRFLIVPKRKYASAEKYKTVWMKEGSPLLIHTDNLTKKLDQRMPDHDVFFAMRYGTPSIKEVMLKLKKYDSITIMPLYPQDTKSSYLTASEEVEKVIRDIDLKSQIDFVPPFYTENFYIESLVEKIKLKMDNKAPDFYLFSYHGIPQHHLPKACVDCTKPCPDSEIIDTCYRAQCYKTTELITSKLALNEEQYMTSFQSRLGKRPWIKPYTDLIIEDLKERGFKNICVLSPSFIVDCLETLEELAIELKEDFEGNSKDRKLTFIPCLNDNDFFVNQLSSYLKTY